MTKLFLFPIIIISSLLVTNSSTLSAQNSGISSETDTIQFVLNDHNNISIPSILNDHDTINLMFHTAINSVSLTPDQCEKLDSINLNKNSASAKSWSGTNDVEFIENNKLQIANLVWDKIPVWLNMLSGPETGGKFGPNLFRNKIIQIDFDENIIILHQSETTILDMKNYETFELSTNEHGSLYIEGILTINNTPIKNKYLIHSGYGGTIILDDQFCKQNPIIKSLPVLEEKDLKDSFGNIIKTKKAAADGFQICHIPFENVPISYFDSDLEIQQTSVLGGELLKRFNLLLDIDKLKLHVKANNYTESSFKSS